MQEKREPDAANAEERSKIQPAHMDTVRIKGWHNHPPDIHHVRWSLVVFGSVLVVFGFLALGIRSLPLAAGACGAASGVITFLLSVIKDLDNPFTGVWNVSYAPFVNATSRVA